MSQVNDKALARNIRATVRKLNGLLKVANKNKVEVYLSIYPYAPWVGNGGVTKQITADYIGRSVKL